MIKNNSHSVVLLLLLIFSLSLRADAQHRQLHTIKLRKPADLQAYFHYTNKREPIVSGHRGGQENNLPENSISAFENTLKYTPAFFEIDPRLTKDSVIILMHDETLERTTTGKGKVSDYTWAELRQLNLKDVEGNVTTYHIPTLSEAIDWARNKTILSLDWKGVPYEMTAELINKKNAHAFVMVGIQNLKQAQFYLHNNRNYMFAMLINSAAKLAEIEEGGIPLKQVMAYVGSQDKPENRGLYDLLHKKGIMCMVAAAPIYDKLKLADERSLAYQQIIRNGVDILESDRPIEVSKALQGH
ncbi:Glycerophosphoryl diester phosphodiesterase [Arcticibacter svalbardensis MN12-7]|uniref:Glycerophosphoryl diester phosphodiesterase n=1 Tax=Arcticibacter svalbardensis MN12-7 TaxID=1150600 RepID=R9GRY9_9SPHI|nr:glycerophosphodiester phosphodiesterase family protein [Arcticibacter svalbardensis]EOR94315.1 Glycerophosphoryl diester phosphodiesterase [Arcticibacter svalbardensis MN12-7]